MVDSERKGTRQDWSEQEVAATVATYLLMLRLELDRRPYNKREHNRRLQSLLRGRSAGAIEFKHANISAILIELGFPYIDGYKPRRNYQDLLKSEVLAQLDGDVALSVAAQAVVSAPVEGMFSIESLGNIFVDAPQRERPRGTYERRAAQVVPRRINYLEREARNAALGAAGEHLILQVEHRRLWEAGRRELANKIEHVSQTRGDGLGYDIVSYEETGRERLIEVKTTNFGVMTPFFASAREVNVSESEAQSYYLYRVFKFRDAPRVFSLPGSLRQTCDLDPTEYRANLL